VERNELLADGLMRVAEAAEFLAVGKSTVYAMTNDGTLPYVCVRNGRRIPRRAVRELAEGRLVEGPAAPPPKLPRREVQRRAQHEATMRELKRRGYL
jgi:excisionase family DNA binding protein